MAFFPQEDPTQLTTWKSKLSPFLEAVAKALSFDLEKPDRRREDLFDEILRDLPVENSTSNLFTGLTQASDTLKLEFDKLLNLK